VKYRIMVIQPDKVTRLTCEDFELTSLGLTIKDPRVQGMDEKFDAVLFPWESMLSSWTMAVTDE
jgi:hypothetical protein